MMKNKFGFTLAEILAVIVIIGLLLLLIAPSIINKIGTKQQQITEAQEEIIVSATELYIDSNQSTYSENGTYCIEVQTLIDNGYLQENFTDSASDDKDVYDGKYVKVVVSNSTTDLSVVDSCS